MSAERRLLGSIVRLEHALARLTHYADDPQSAQQARIFVAKALEELKALRRELTPPQRRLEETNFIGLESA